MGRPPCCDKVGIKKGPWTPEEDIILVSYIQQHGPGNWRSVPTDTGLLRCSKSCRLRWTNYLRPGIKRGNFTPHEQGMIIHLQALLGNKWAAIASYLPQRTDNDIKNYWNTHLKKKLKRFQSSLDPAAAAAGLPSSSDDSKFGSSAKDFNDKKSSSSFDITASHSSSSKLNGINSVSSTSSYASSTENISRLLEGWMRSSPRGSDSNNYTKMQQINNGNNISVHHQYNTDQSKCMANEEFESVLSFGQDVNNHNNVNATWISTFCSDSASNLDGSRSQDAAMGEDEKMNIINTATGEDEKMNIINNHTSIIVAAEKKQMTKKSENDDNDHAAAIPPFTILEKWLLDETLTGGQVEEIMQLSPIF